MALDEEHCI